VFLEKIKKTLIAIQPERFFHFALFILVFLEFSTLKINLSNPCCVKELSTELTLKGLYAVKQMCAKDKKKKNSIKSAAEDQQLICGEWSSHGKMSRNK
jgi:hypothetical protein